MLRIYAQQFNQALQINGRGVNAVTVTKHPNVIG